MNNPLPFSDSNVTERCFADAMDELADRMLAGETVDIDAYVERHPQLAQRLRMAFKSLQAVHALRSDWPAPDDLSVESTSIVPLGQLGDFRLIREMGRGGMGIVYEAEQISLARRVALKVLPYASLLDDRQLKRFRTESLAAATLKHPRIVSVYSVGTDRSVHYYAMELIDGHSLADILQQRRQESVEPIPQADVSTDPIAMLSTSGGSNRSTDLYRRVAQLGVEIADALEYAHQEGVIHRDIKPGNLLLNREGRVYVTDFGLARISANEDLTLSGDVVGTLRYMSPEQLNDSRRVDERTDIYSLGVTLFEIATAQPMFDAQDKPALIRELLETPPRSLRAVDPTAPRDLTVILLKAAAKDPNDRYSSARDMADDLQRYLDRRPVQARMAGPVMRSWRWCQRNSRVTVLVATVMVLLAALAAVGFHGKLRFAKLAGEQQWALYVSDIKRVQELNRQGNADEARRVLMRHVDDESRNFEWGLLLNECDANVPQVVVKNRVESLAVDFSPDGSTFVTTEWLPRSVVWDAKTGEELHRLEIVDHGRFYDAKFAIDGQSLFLAHQAGSVHRWDGVSATSHRLGVEGGEWIASSKRITHAFDRTKATEDGLYFAIPTANRDRIRVGHGCCIIGFDGSFCRRAGRDRRGG